MPPRSSSALTSLLVAQVQCLNLNYTETLYYQEHSDYLQMSLPICVLTVTDVALNPLIPPFGTWPPASRR